MARFIPLSCYSECYSSEADLLDGAAFGVFVETVKGEKGALLANKAGYSQEDHNAFLSSLKNPSAVLFYDWIAKHSTLLKFLTTEQVGEAFTDEKGYLKHTLGSDFKRFITPFLANVLLKYAGETDTKTLVKLFSFVVLLDEDNSALVETQLFRVLQEQLNQLKDQVRQIREEQELIELIQPLCSDDIIQIVNHLSRRSYSIKLGYVDSILLAVKGKACTVRFANWIFKRMELLTLNKEHEHKISDLKRELREGALHVRNSGNRSNGKLYINWRSIMAATAMVAFAGILFYLIKYQPYSDVAPMENQTTTAFTQFSIEERKKIDSIVQAMASEHEPDELFDDMYDPIIGNSATLTIRTSFDNETMEGIYEDLDRDADLQEAGYVDSCHQKISFKPLPGVKDIKDYTGSFTGMIRNESDYDVVLFIADDNVNGNVYSMMVKVGETKTFQMDLMWTIMAVPGTHYQTYNAPSNPGPYRVPSDDYDYHFCKTDANFKEAVNTGYRLVSLGAKSKGKFMLNGGPNDYFQLIDVHQVLEEL